MRKSKALLPSALDHARRHLVLCVMHSQLLVGVAACITVTLQMGFFSIVGIPLFKAMAELFEESKPMLDGVLANYRYWEAATPDADLPPL